MTKSKKGVLSKSQKRTLERAMVKKRRKSQSQKRNLESRAKIKSKSNAKKRDEVTHSTGFVFFEPEFAMNRSFQIGLFTFQPVNPISHNLGGAESFKNKEDYWKYAPFRSKLMAELTTCEKDWDRVMIGNERFTDSAF